jgi:uncharacterized protein
VLIQFRVENHRSLRDEQVFSLVASSDRAGAHVFRSEGLGEALVPVAAIYGANASGKSNVLGSLDFMRRAIRDSQRRWDVDGTPRDPFLLSGKAEEPSLYEVDIIVGGVRYRYGFQLSSSRIEEEWLFAWPHGRKAMWFERDGERFEFGKTLHGENEAIRNLTRPNSLFMSAAAQNNHVALLPIFRHFLAWRMSLSRRSDSLASSEIVERLDARGGATDRAAILQLLRDADTGIVDVRVASVEESTKRLESVKRRGTVLAEGTADLAAVEALVQAAVRRAPGTVLFRHRSADDERAWLPLSAESAGTIALLNLAPCVVDALRSGSLLCIDELEASMHPTLALRLVRMFNDPAHNPNGAQLVFSTHDTNLLGTVAGEPVLRRDQVWFTEKDDRGATHLYPLTDFHPRKEENLERGYLQGRYGAIPFLGALIRSAIGGEPADGGADDGGDATQAGAVTGQPSVGDEDT